MGELFESNVRLQWLRYAGPIESTMLVQRLDELIPRSYDDPSCLLEAISILDVLKEQPSSEVGNALKGLIEKRQDSWCENAGLILIVNILDIIVALKRDEDIDFLDSMMCWDVFQVPCHLLLLARKYEWTALWKRIGLVDIESEYDEAIRTQYYETLTFIDSLHPIDQALGELLHLLDTREEDESAYQSWFERYPWAFGAMYSRIESHRFFNESNIPDFTAVRVKDSARDILEIKQPFVKLFRADGEFSAEFNAAWNQAERYVAFARQEHDYLRRKGLVFDNPSCHLILGYALSSSEMASIRRKESMNPWVTVLTYDDVCRLVETTINLTRRVSK